jgi:hypothetical protein
MYNEKNVSVKKDEFLYVENSEDKYIFGHNDPFELSICFRIDGKMDDMVDDTTNDTTIDTTIDKSPIKSADKLPIKSADKSVIKSPIKSLIKSADKSLIKSADKSTVKSLTIHVDEQKLPEYNLISKWNTSNNTGNWYLSFNKNKLIMHRGTQPWIVDFDYKFIKDGIYTIKLIYDGEYLDADISGTTGNIKTKKEFKQPSIATSTDKLMVGGDIDLSIYSLKINQEEWFLPELTPTNGDMDSKLHIYKKIDESIIENNL